MVGACTPAAAATARVDTASRPPSARRLAAARTILSLVPARLPTITRLMTQTITYFCYQWLRIVGSVITLAVLANRFWRADRESGQGERAERSSSSRRSLQTGAQKRSFHDIDHASWWNVRLCR